MKSLLLTSVCVLSLTACVSSRDYTGAPTISGAADTKIEALGNQRFQDVEIISKWWESLQDQQLNKLIDMSLDNNKDIGVARLNLEEARSIARETGFDRYPTVTANGAYKRSRSSGELGLGESQVTNNFNAGFDANWELDLFGRVSERVKGSQARKDIAEASLRHVYVTISSEVARTYVELRGAQHRLNIATRNTKNQADTYRLTKKLVEGGRGTNLDVARAKTQLELTRSTIPTLDAEVTGTINRLSVLSGQVPDALRSDLVKMMPLPSIPEVVNVGNVSDLLRRRPDIIAAEYALVATVADYNVAVSDQFPVVNIVGVLGFAATTFSSFGASAVAASVGPSVNWSAFDMGRVYARIDQSDARAHAAVATYEKTVLYALEELQTSVSNFSKEEERRGYLQRAARSGREAATLARKRYEAGVDTFIEVLDAEATLLQAEDTLAQSEISTALDLIAIYKALGGGWQGVVDDTSKAVSR
ncbi:MAG: transporter [Zetaproteobacteria bacterium]|nr:MAG: transporter [Zetaproteobacteria bacterium]